MSGRLFAVVSVIVLMVATTMTTIAQNNTLQKQITELNRELIIVVVDAEGFVDQDVVKPDNYKSRHHSNIDWLRKNWYSFITSVREKKSYQVRLNVQTYNALSPSQKSKLEELYSACYTGTFDPVGLAKVQLSKIKYSPKFDEKNEQVYQKLVLTQQDIEKYVQNKKTAVLVLNAQTASQISSIIN